MNKKGFTLIELLVAIAILGLVMAAIVTVLVNSSNAKRRNELMMESQGFARAIMEVVFRDVKSAGYGIPKRAGLLTYEHIVYAGPFECVFNANINPFPDNDTNAQQPRSYDPSVNPICPNYGFLTSSHNTGVETYRYTLDSNNDGLVTTADNADDSVEIRSRNPNDYVLIRQCYGRMNNGTNAVFPVINQMVGLVRGPASASDISVAPLFQYWYRNTSGNLVLLGDANGDGELTGNERLFASPTADILRAIEEIVITVTGETRAPLDNKNQYPQVVIASRTNLSNVPLNVSSRKISGYYKDMSNSGIQGGVVYLSTFQTSTTVSDGSYEFRVDDGGYTITPEKLFYVSPNYYLLDSPQVRTFSLYGTDSTNQNFYYHTILESSMCHIVGMVYNDTAGTIGPPAIPDLGLNPPERGISGSRIAVQGYAAIDSQTQINLETYTDANGYYSLTLPRGRYTVFQFDSVGYFSTTPSILEDTLAADGETDTVNFGDNKSETGFIKVLVWKDVDKDSIQDASEPLLSNVFCAVTRGGDLDIPVSSGRTDANGVVILPVPSDTVCSVYKIDPDTMTSIVAVRLKYGNPADSVVYPLLSRIENIVVDKDSTYRTKFGSTTGFVTISLGQTQRVLSLICPNLGEKDDPPGNHRNTNSQNDNDIVLGTVKVSGSANLLVWYNRWQSAATPLGNIFPSSPDSSRDLGHSIPALAYGNFDLILTPSVLTDDVAAGLERNAGTNNFRIGLTANSGGTQDCNRGILWSTVRDYSTTSVVANTDVICLAAGNLSNSSKIDLAVGTKTLPNTGTVEIWRNRTTTSPAAFNMGSSSANNVPDTVLATASGPTLLGEVNALELADVVDSTGTKGSDGLPDLIIGTKTGDYPNYSGQLVIYRRAGQNRRFTFHFCYNFTNAYVNALTTYLSGKTTNTKLDIVAGIRTLGGQADEHLGALAMFYNNNDGTYGNAGAPTQVVTLPGEPLSLASARINIDNYPDVVVGIKMGIGDNTGQTLIYYSSFSSSQGTLASTGVDPSGGANDGEAVVVRTSVLRPSPGRNDIIVGERFESGGNMYGRVIIYFNAY